MLGKITFSDGTNMLFGFDNVEASSMIISNRLTKVLAGASFSIQHYLNGEENEYAECIQGSPRDLIDLYDAGRRKRLKYATVDFVVAPYVGLTRDEFLHVVLPMMAWVFSFGAMQAIIFEHKKIRINGGADIHWHVCVSYSDPITDRVNREGWAWSHAKCERVSRHLEALYEPNNILLGRHQAAVIKALRADGLDAIADKIEAAHPPGATPENRTPPLMIEQPAKAAGIDLREIAKVVKAAFYASHDRAEFSAALAENGLALAASNRSEKPAWVICGGPDGGFINTLSRCLPGVSRVNIHTKLGEPDDDAGRRDASHECRPEVAGDVDDDPPRIEGSAHGVGLVDSSPVGPVVDDDTRSAELFCEALEELEQDTGAVGRVMSMATELAQGAVARVLAFFRAVEYQARLWLDQKRVANPDMYPQPDPMLQALREEGERLKQAKGTANTLLHAINSKISRLLGMPASHLSGSAAHAHQFDKINKQQKEAEEAHNAAAAAYETHLAKAAPFEKVLNDHRDIWEKRHTEVATAWLSIVKNVREALQATPLLAQYGPRALLAIGMPRNLVKPVHFDGLADDTATDDYSGPRGPK